MCTMTGMEWMNYSISQTTHFIGMLTSSSSKLEPSMPMCSKRRLFVRLRSTVRIYQYLHKREKTTKSSAGKGRGPLNQRSRQVYALANVTLRRQKGPIIGAGQSIWNHVHVHDLSDLYVLLIDAAIAGRTDDGLWGPRAYYLAENGEHCWGELAQATAEAAAKLGYLPEAKTEVLDPESAKKYAGYESLSWGMNSRGRSQRARELLAWNPSRPSVVDELPGIVRVEWERLQNAS